MVNATFFSDMGILVQDPFFLFVTTAIGALLGIVIKAGFDVWTAEAKRRNDLADHVMKQIEQNAPVYYLMSNYASLLSNSLNLYMDQKRQLQMMPVYGTTSPAYDLLKSSARDTAKKALFESAVLYSVISGHFWEKGGDYFMPDQWANEAIVDLHNSLMEVFRVDIDILQKHIKATSDLPDFNARLKDSETNPDLKDLKEAHEKYQEWILRNDAEVKKAVFYAQAYSDLFGQQMIRLYKDWYERGVRSWFKRVVLQEPTDDPRNAPEVINDPSVLEMETRELILLAVSDRSKIRQERSKFALREIKGVKGDNIINDSNAFYELGWNYYIANNYDMAIAEYQKAIKVDPGNAIVYNNLGNAYAANGEFENAFKAFEEAIERDPNNPQIHANFGEALYQNANSSEALNTDEKYEKAKQCYLKAIELEPTNSYFHNSLGHTFFFWNKLDDAVEAYHKAITLNMSNPFLYENLATVFDKQKKYFEALWAFQRAIDTSPDDDKDDELRYCQMGAIHNETGNLQQSVWAFLKALECSGDDNTSVLNVLETQDSPWLSEQNNRDLVIGACKKIIGKYPKDAIPRINLGGIYFDLGDYLKAGNEIYKAICINPENPRYWYLFGEMSSHLDCPDVVSRYYKKATELDPENKDYLFALGLVYINMGRYDDAKIPLEKILEMQPEDIDTLLALSEVYASGSQPDWKKATDTCLKAKVKDPDYCWSYGFYGSLLAGQGDLTGAAEEFETALARNPDDVKKRALLDKLIDTLLKAIEAEPGNAVLYGKIGSVYERVGDIEKAAKAYRDAVDRAPDGNPAFQMSLSMISGTEYFNTGDPDNALHEWERAAQISENNPSMLSDSMKATLYNNIGIAYDKLGKIEDALKNYITAKSLDQNNQEIHFNTGSALYRNDQILTALSDFQEANRLEPENPRFLLNIGNCYYCMNDDDLARESWEDALRLEPELYEAAYNIGVSSFNKGDKAGAVQQWQKISSRFEPARQAAEESAIENPVSCMQIIDFKNPGE